MKNLWGCFSAVAREGRRPRLLQSLAAFYSSLYRAKHRRQAPRRSAAAMKNLEV